MDTKGKLYPSMRHEILNEREKEKVYHDVKKYMEDILPLNMTFSIDVLWNQYKILTGKRYADITKYTYGELREKVIV